MWYLKQNLKKNVQIRPLQACEVDLVAGQALLLFRLPLPLNCFLPSL